MQKGFNSTLYGFIAIAVFMILYYHLFGVFSVIALIGQSAVADWPAVDPAGDPDLARHHRNCADLGIAIDANVLINERIQKKLSVGQVWKPNA